MGETNKVMQFKKKMSAFTIAVMIFFLCVAIGVIPLITYSNDDIYIKVSDAIRQSESQKDFSLEFTTASEIFVGSDSKRVDATGYIISTDYLENVMVFANTFSTTSYNPESDFNVTVSLYSDGDKVYDYSTGKNVEVDMSSAEFREIVQAYSLYHYDPKDAVSVVFEENSMEEYKGSGNVTVDLKTPGEATLQSFSDAIYEAIGERINPKDLTVNKATVVYKIFYDMVIAQRYDFSVSCTLSNSKTLIYTASSQVTYNTEAFDDADGEYEYQTFDNTQEVTVND